MRSLDGIRDFEAEVGSLSVIIKPARDRVLDLYAVRRALATERVRLHGMRIVAEGRVEGRGEAGQRFRIDGWPEAFPIRGDNLPNGHARIRASVTFKAGVPQLRLIDS